MIRLGALLFCCLFVSSTRADCGYGWKSFKDSCYLFVDNFMDWYDSQADCVRRGGHLVDIVDAEENEFIHSNLHDYWNWHHIGLSDTIDEGTFKWVTGTAMEYDNFWPGEPNDSRGAEDCAEMRYSGLWNDVSCYKNQYYICEKEASDSGTVDTTSGDPTSADATTTTEQYDFLWK
ncbi:perlucin-like protein [Mytilus galloprovincialis]|uniref:C-type lectin superfamily 17 member A n=1 Tax=Mytilus galloprovincialis TaxID=29158 RepID=A0A8B6EA68_MYTGA|nr:C-type lectin superfamily 17 member A [Mytilus galloprovincialis]